VGLLLAISLSLITDLFQIGAHPQVLEQDSVYGRIALTDSTYMEMYMADNIIVVYTACAPRCSSCARVYNKEWEFLFPIEPPIHSVFPLATIDKTTGRIIWTDNDQWEY